MLVKINEDCVACDFSDKGKIVDAIKCYGDQYTYFCQNGCQWYLSDNDIEVLNIYTTEQINGISSF